MALGCEGHGKTIAFEIPRAGAPSGIAANGGGSGSSSAGSGSGAMGGSDPFYGGDVMLSTGGMSAALPHVQQDAAAAAAACERARANGATFCEYLDLPCTPRLEYCEPIADAGGCPQDEPQWVYDGVRLRCSESFVEFYKSPRMLDGGCCYIAQGIFAGR
jgi:hypothetical protein